MYYKIVKEKWDVICITLMLTWHIEINAYFRKLYLKIIFHSQSNFSGQFR